MRGRVDRDASGGGSFTAAEVEERLVEAMLTCWRDADRERGWLRVRSAWPEVAADPGDYDARGGDGEAARLKPASLTRAEVGAMEEAFGWAGVLAPAERKLVGIVVTVLAKGRREVDWIAVMRRLGLTRGRDGLRMRYARALAKVAARANRRKSTGEAGQPPLISRDDI